jgi:hypothetical protein
VKGNVEEVFMRWLSVSRTYQTDEGLISWWYHRLRSVRNTAVPLREYFSSTRLSLKQSVLDGDIIDFRVPKKRDAIERAPFSVSTLSRAVQFMR